MLKLSLINVGSARTYACTHARTHKRTYKLSPKHASRYAQSTSLLTQRCDGEQGAPLLSEGLSVLARLEFLRESSAFAEGPWPRYGNPCPASRSRFHARMSCVSHRPNFGAPSISPSNLPPPPLPVPYRRRNPLLESTMHRDRRRGPPSRTRQERRPLLSSAFLFFVLRERVTCRSFITAGCPENIFGMFSLE